MDLRDIVELVNLVSSKEIGELEVEKEGFRVRIVKAVPAPVAGGLAGAAPPSVEVVRVSPETGVAGAGAAVADDPDLYVMKSPIVGTFYRSPNPTAEPYIRPGDRVKKGQLMCIIEAMKLMNEIESEVSGVLVEILVEDGQPVEFGEPLFKVRPDP